MLLPNDANQIQTPEAVSNIPPSVEVFLRPEVLQNNFIIDRMMEGLQILHHNQNDAMKLHEIRKITMWKRYVDCLLENQSLVGKMLADSLSDILLKSRSDSTLKEFAIVALQSLAEESKLTVSKTAIVCVNIF